jgi:hypothetical protein
MNSWGFKKATDLAKATKVPWKMTGIIPKHKYFWMQNNHCVYSWVTTYKTIALEM